jgi:hypothetical protein
VASARNPSLRIMVPREGTYRQRTKQRMGERSIRLYRISSSRSSSVVKFSIKGAKAEKKSVKGLGYEEAAELPRYINPSIVVCLPS